MKAYATFDAWLADRPARLKPAAKALRIMVQRAAPNLAETVKWGNGCWVKGDVPVAYAYGAPDHLQFGFFMGSKLDDPKGLLIGAGQYVRHVKVRRPEDLDAPALRMLLKQAAAAR
jgi:hypothetical protein